MANALPQVDLEAVMARMSIYDRTKAVGEAATPPSLSSPREAPDGRDSGYVPAEGAAGADVYRELQELREVWNEDKRELDKARLKPTLLPGGCMPAAVESLNGCARL